MFALESKLRAVRARQPLRGMMQCPEARVAVGLKFRARESVQPSTAYVHPPESILARGS